MKPYYGFLSNGQTSALVSPEASIDWLAFPHFDSDAVFCRILDENAGGHMSLHLESRHHADQDYLPGTNVLETTLRTPAGLATVTDYLVIGRAELRRLARSDVPLVLECSPRFGYGQSLADLDLLPEGALYRDPRGKAALLLTLRGPKVRRIGRERWLLPPGEHELVLRYTPDFDKEQQELAPPEDDPQFNLDGAVAYWRSCLPPAACPEVLMPAVERSLLTVRGLTVRATGAILAAPSTSLPEQLGGARNWDYRYVWVRDASYAAEALLLAGDRLATRRLIEFLLGAVQMTGKPFPSPFMRGDGSFSLGERDLGWLSGHRGSQPVRVGNAASAQLQLDVEGDLLWAIWRYVQETEDAELPRGCWWAIERMANWTAACWRHPDASLWEFREAPRRYTHSLVMCWVALQAATRLALVAGHREQAARWHRAACNVQDDLWTHCFQPDLGIFTQGVGLREVDAALLCLPLYGFLPAADPRWQATLQRIEADLVRDGLVHRYARDFMGVARHPFTLGSSWLARAYLRGAQEDRALEVLERLVSAATPLLLWGEHVDPGTGEQRGNFPQLFPHAGFIAAASELAQLRCGDGLRDPWGGLPPFDLDL